MGVVDEVDDSLSVAVIGMAGRFPGSDDLESYWDNIAGGIESIRDVSEDELVSSGVPRSHYESENYVRRASVLDDADCFDARFFGYSPREAESIDPQQRIFLEVCWEALEHAGYRPDGCEGQVGIFAGCAMNTYLLNAGLVERFQNDYLPTLIGNDKDYLATRVAFKLGLTGPAMTIQTACSSSLVAIHTACQSLLNGECDVAIAGGSAIRVPLLAGHFHSEGSVFSQDGHVRSFDSKANGTVFGSGAGAVVLKSLDSALEAKDPILAIIRGSAINNDGASKSEYTAPSLNSQADLIAEAMGAAGVSPDSVSYVEAHGTGTFLGDPIEIAALSRAYRVETSKRSYCAIGTVKANIGHLDAAAGVAGVIKLILSMQHRKLPPLAGFKAPNPEINFEESPFYVNDQLRDWEPISGIRRAGITSLGIGGTNAHLIIDGVEGAGVVETDANKTLKIIPLSAKSEGSLKRSGQRIGSKLSRNPQMDLAEVAYTLQQRAGDFRERLAVVGDNVADVALTFSEQGENLISGRAFDTFRTLFVFSGQGSQHLRMGVGLYLEYSVYREAINECCSILDSIGASGIRKYVTPQTDVTPKDLAVELAKTKNTQPALFAIEYATAKLWQSILDDVPSGMLGHSIGEYVAATLSGVFSLQDALAIVTERGRLMQSMEEGWMMAVSSTEQALLDLLPDDVSISVENGDELFAIGGPFELFDAVGEILEKADIPWRKLHTSHAFHSAMMEPMLEQFEKFVGKYQLGQPSIPFVSNVTGHWIESHEASNPEYWARHIRSTVRFSRGLRALIKDQKAVVIECGPGQALTSLVKQHRSDKELIGLASLPRANVEGSDVKHFMTAVARYWTLGGNVLWEATSVENSSSRVGLPGYAFERTRHWPSLNKMVGGIASHSHKSERPNLFVPSWTRLMSLKGMETAIASSFSWVLFVRDNAFGKRLADRLRGQGAEYFVVAAGANFESTDDGRFIVNPRDSTHFMRVFSEVKEKSALPLKVVHAWNTGETDTDINSLNKEHEKAISFESFLSVFSAAEEVFPSGLDMIVYTQGAQSFGASDSVNPFRSMVEPTCRALSREYPERKVTTIEIEASTSAEIEVPLSLQDGPEGRNTLVVRDGYYWSRSYEKIERSKVAEIEFQGTYLITGGLGGIGRQIAAKWARDYGCQIVVMSRSKFPSSDVWKDTAQHETLTDSQREIAHLFCEATVDQGSIEVIQGDVTLEDEMTRVIDEINQRCGRLSGVVHAAGGVDPKLSSMKSPSDIETVLAPKIDGTLSLMNALASSSPDFLVLFSSIRALQAPMGLVDYAAANAFLDAIAENEEWAYPVISINWPGWANTGMISDSEQNTYDDTVSISEGLDLLAESIFSADTRRRTVISKKPATEIELVDEVVEDRTGPEFKMPVTDLTEGTDSERGIIFVWSELLGINDIKLNDDFFDLGGSSLLAAKCLTKIKEVLGVKLSLKSFLSERTVRKLGAVIDSQKSEK